MSRWRAAWLLNAWSLNLETQAAGLGLRGIEASITLSNVNGMGWDNLCVVTLKAQGFLLKGELLVTPAPQRPVPGRSQGAPKVSRGSRCSDYLSPTRVAATEVPEPSGLPAKMSSSERRGRDSGGSCLNTASHTHIPRPPHGEGNYQEQTVSPLLTEESGCRCAQGGALSRTRLASDGNGGCRVISGFGRKSQYLDVEPGDAALGTQQSVKSISGC